VLERIGQRFLHDPAGGQVDAGGQRAWLSGDPDFDRKTGERDLVDQRAQPAQAWLRRQILLVLAGGRGRQQAQQVP
jgi:hypothetical protein